MHNTFSAKTVSISVRTLCTHYPIVFTNGFQLSSQTGDRTICTKLYFGNCNMYKFILGNNTDWGVVLYCHGVTLITNIVNDPLQKESFPSCFNSTDVTLFLKNADLNRNTLKNHQSTSILR